MKVNVFLPKYMVDFKCVGSECVDTCCAGWDINIDENSYNRYMESEGELKELVDGKFKENKHNHDFFSKGFMILKDESRCPFLNSNMLCDIHGNIGEKHLCITCKNYPRVFNIVDDIYEKSGLPSCAEICLKAFLNREKMEFVEREESIDEENIEIRRIIDTEAFNGTDSLLQYFWEIRVISINILQNRNFSIEERLNILKEFYKILYQLKKNDDIEEIENVLEDFNDNDVNYEELKGRAFEETDEFYFEIINEQLLENIKSLRLKDCIKEYRSGIADKKIISEELNEVSENLQSYSYIFEHYLVNQIFKDLIPFNKGEDLMKSVTVLINSYRILKAYISGINLNSTETLDENIIIRVIQSLSKEIEHNKVFKTLLENS